MQQESGYLFFKRSRVIFFIAGLLGAGLLSFATFKLEFMVPLIIIGLGVAIIYSVFLFKNPRVGFFTTLIYAFVLGFFGREIGGLQYGLGLELFLVLTWLASAFYYNKTEWAELKNDLCLLFFIWFIFSVLQVINPAGASVRGWLQEIRFVALYPILVIPITFVVLRKRTDLDVVIKYLLVLAFIAALNGIKQSKIGLWPGEQAFIDSPEGATHMIWGKLRAFSFYDAGQFGAFESVFIVMAIVLGLGSSKSWKLALLFFLAAIYGYAMLLSGTRGAFFAMFVAAVVAIVLSKNFKILILGGVVMVMFLGVLKFTNIGSGNYSIQRFRSSLDPEDPSLNVRFSTQRVLREYMSSRPFGGGLGVLGGYAIYNKDKFLATVQPDSYWVKLWAMTGIVGLTLWFGMMMYILGKCCGIVWKIQDKKLKVKLIALLSATAGLFFCSYGNEVINNMPSSIIACLTFALVYMGPKFDREIADEKLLVHDELSPQDRHYIN